MTLGEDRPRLMHPVAVIGLMALLVACTGKETPMDDGTLRTFATRYTAAWCSHQSARVAALYAQSGSLTINDGTPSTGREAITAAAQGFMTTFPDLVVRMDGAGVEDGRIVYRWTATGTNTGPGGNGRSVRFSGYEEWTFAADGRIAESKGHFDEADYQRQLRSRAASARQAASSDR